jgi:CheY-like chemotaxis protein
VVIAEDSVLLREGIGRLEESGFEVAGHAGDGEDLLRKVGAHKPDIAVVDIRMPPTHTNDGLRAAHRIRAEHPVSERAVEKHVTRDLPSSTCHPRSRTTDVCWPCLRSCGPSSLARPRRSGRPRSEGRVGAPTPS